MYAWECNFFSYYIYALIYSLAHLHINIKYRFFFFFLFICFDFFLFAYSINYVTSSIANWLKSICNLTIFWLNFFYF